MKITISKKEIDKAASSLKYVERSIPKAVSRALNETARGVRTEAARQIRQTYAVKHGGLLKEINIETASAKKLGALIHNKGSNIPLIRFKTSPAKLPKRQPKVLKATVKKGGARKPIPGAFVADLGKHGLGVFRRTGPARRAKAEQTMGPGIPVMMNNPAITEHLEKEAHSRMESSLKRTVNHILGEFKFK